MYLKILQLLTLGFIAFISFVFLKNEFSVLRFIIVSAVWVAVFAFCFVSDKLKLVELSLQSLGVIIASTAVLISALTMIFQQTPTLLLKDFQLRQAENRVYLYFQNEGSIGAWYIKGAYSLILTQEPGEPGSGITSNEKLAAFGGFEEEGAFYPNNLEIISTKLKMTENLEQLKKTGAVYFFIHIEYPRLQIGKFKISGKGYDGVFYLNDEMKWKIMAKNHLPRLFKYVISSLKEGVEPKLPLSA